MSYIILRGNFIFVWGFLFIYLKVVVGLISRGYKCFICSLSCGILIMVRVVILIVVVSLVSKEIGGEKEVEL